jgi:hypothetical protein
MDRSDRVFTAVTAILIPWILLALVLGYLLLLHADR